MKQFQNNPLRSRTDSQARRRRGFTLLQLLVVVAVIGTLSAVLISAFGNSRASARRAQCDTQLKAITMALDAFRQENGEYPAHLHELVADKYLSDPTILHCPSDPRQNASRNDFYLLRAARDSGELPILVCPLCAGESYSGMQAFKGRYTKQFATRPAMFTAVSGATIEKPGKNPIAARSGMQLRGGDIIRTPQGGSAEIRFADGSTSTLRGNSEITLLQSFIAGNTHAPLYTLISQKAGDVAYKVTHGSKFDVSTPTATAGALGTAFEIKEDANGEWWMVVTQSKVLVSDLDRRKIVAAPSADTSKNSHPDVPLTVSSDWSSMGESELEDDPITGKKEKKPKNKNKGKGNNNGNGNDDDEDDD